MLRARRGREPGEVGVAALAEGGQRLPVGRASGEPAEARVLALSCFARTASSRASSSNVLVAIEGVHGHGRDLPCATDIASSSSCSGSQTRQASPVSTARSASSQLAVKRRWAAFCQPTRWAAAHCCPPRPSHPGSRRAPAARAPRAISTRSQWGSRVSPIPTPIPLTAAIERLREGLGGLDERREAVARAVVVARRPSPSPRGPAPR